MIVRNDWKLSNKIAQKVIALSVAAIAVSLTACSSPSEVTQTEPNPVESPLTQTEPNPAESPTEVAVTSVADLGEVKFQDTQETSTSGSFDAVNGSGQPNHSLSKAEPLILEGWAILPTQGKPADKVIITAGDDNSVVTVAPVEVERPDVAQAQNNSALAKSGWATTIDPNTLSGDRLMLKAWAYNADTKEATPLGNVHEVMLK